MYIDLSCTSAVYSTLTAAVASPNAATSGRETAKKSMIDAAYIPAQLKSKFLPFVWTDTCRLGKKAVEFLDRITKRNVVPGVHDARLAGARRHFIRSIGVITERYNPQEELNLELSDSIFFYIPFYNYVK